MTKQPSTYISVPNYMAILAFTPVPQNPIVNGYEISKVEGCKLWSCIKVGQGRGIGFKTKRAAVAYANAN
jgi:hypothetical protein